MSASQNGKSLILILGAGASNEVGLPVGKKLKQEIAELLDIRFELGNRRTSGDQEIIDALRAHVSTQDGRPGDTNPLFRASRRICAAMPQAESIDSFIENHRGDHLIALCAKLAIVKCILAAEQTSKLRVDPSNVYNTINFTSVADTWFNSFFSLVTENCQKDGLCARFQKVAIVSFNYDRCIEHYLYGALQNYYGLSADEAKQALVSLEIHHPYGMVGALPWVGDADAGVRFGAPLHPRQLLTVAKQLKTFSEGTDPATSDIDAIRRLLTHAERIAFLGFAFHRLNLDLLFSNDQTSKKRRVCPVYATALDISNSNTLNITNDLARRGGLDHSHIRLRELRCAELFREYSRDLTLY